MDNVVFLFPLLHLPKEDLMRVLRNMEILQQIGFSLCSKKSKSLIKSLNMKVSKMYMTVSETIRLEMFPDDMSLIRLNFFVDESSILPAENEQEPRKLQIPRDIDIMIRVVDEFEITVRFKNPGYSVRNWLDHFLEIFNRSKIDELRFKRGYQSYNFESIQETVYGLNVKKLSLVHVQPNQEFYNVLRTILPTKQLQLAVRMYKYPESIHQFLMQNFDFLVFGGAFQAVLNDLLVINSLEVLIYHSVLTEKELNTFLKLWINGSNSRLRYLWVHYHTTNDKKIFDEKHLLKGIKYQVVSPENVRIFKTIDEYSDDHTIMEINNGYDIWRNDGTVATIQTTSDDDVYTFEMFVWN